MLFITLLKLIDKGTQGNIFLEKQATIAIVKLLNT